MTGPTLDGLDFDGVVALQEENARLREAIDDLSYCPFCEGDGVDGPLVHDGDCWYAALQETKP